MSQLLETRYLAAIRLKRDEVPDFSAYPFCIPALNGLKRLEFHPAVTFLVGENGAGKSTLLEALAIKVGFNPEGGGRNFGFETRASHSDLYKFLVPERSVIRPRDGYFVRGESFYNLATEIDNLGVGYYTTPLLAAHSGGSLHEQSHGESFFSLLMNRFGGNGLYLFDEPEAALSPSRQMSMLTLIHELVRQKSQLIIATHSPILLAYPDSWIYQLSETGIKRVKYVETEPYVVTRDFLTRHEMMLKTLLEENPELPLND